MKTYPCTGCEIDFSKVSQKNNPPLPGEMILTIPPYSQANHKELTESYHPPL